MWFRDPQGLAVSSLRGLIRNSLATIAPGQIKNVDWGWGRPERHAGLGGNGRCKYRYIIEIRKIFLAGSERFGSLDWGKMVAGCGGIKASLETSEGGIGAVMGRGCFAQVTPRFFIESDGRVLLKLKMRFAQAQGISTALIAGR